MTGVQTCALPILPLVFCETRPLAQEWAYRFLGAAALELATHRPADLAFAQLELVGEVPAPEPTTADVRAWAVLSGLTTSARGRVPAEVWAAYRAAHGSVPG